MEKQNKVNRYKWLILVASALLVILAAGGGILYYIRNFSVSGKISLDCNPGIELEINVRGKVLSCTPVDEDAVLLLGDLNGGKTLEKMDIQVAVNSLVGTYLRHGYLDSFTPTLLVTVCDDNSNRADTRAQELREGVTLILNERAPAASVLTQVIRFDDWRDQKAKSHQITQGKGALVSRIREKNADLAYDKLACLSVEELNDLLEAGAPAMPVGRDEAMKAAMNYAGVAEDTAILSKMKVCLKEDPAVYEVVLLINGQTEVTYRVSAYSGQVLEGKEDILGNGTGGQNNQQSGGKVQDIGAEAAKLLALRRAGLEAENVSNIGVQRKLYDGLPAYEITFDANGITHIYTIDGTDGSLIKYETTDAKGTVLSSKVVERDTGGSGKDKNTDTTQPSSETATETATETAAESESETEKILKLDEAKAIAIATKAHGSVEIKSVQSSVKKLGTRTVYEIGLQDGLYWYFYDIDAETGEILKEWTESAVGTVTDNPTTTTIVKVILNLIGYDVEEVSDIKLESDTKYGYKISFVADGEEQEYGVNLLTRDVVNMKQNLEDKIDEVVPGGDSGESTGDIGAAKARDIALADAGLTIDQVNNMDVSKHRLGNYYSVEFETLTTEYNYKINASTGEITDADNHNT